MHGRNKAAFSFLRFEERFSKSSRFLDGLVCTVEIKQAFSFLRFEERFSKAPFSCRIIVDGRPNRRNKAPFSCGISVDGRSDQRNKAAFSNFSGVVWTRPHTP